VAWKLIGRKVDVRSTATMVQVFPDGGLVKSHVALDQEKRTDKSDYPPEKIAFQMKTPIWCRTQASEIGDACREVVDQLLEAACARAMTVGHPSYRTIKGILVAGAEADPEPETSGDAGGAAFFHGPQGLSGACSLAPAGLPHPVPPSARQLPTVVPDVAHGAAGRGAAADRCGRARAGTAQSPVPSTAAKPAGGTVNWCRWWSTCGT
jgi:hypothetical protein